MKNFLTSRVGILLTIFTFVAMAKLSGNANFLMAPFVFGTVASVGGSPDYTYATGTGNIPVKFATKSLDKFYDTSIVPNISNKDFVGELSQAGDEVVIPTIPDIDISEYVVNSEHDWQLPVSEPVKMKVEQAQLFAFRMDKINIRQFQDKSFMEKCSTDAGHKQARRIDTLFLADVVADAHVSNQGLTAGAKSAFYNLGVPGTPFPVTKGNILDKFVDCGVVLDELLVPKTGRWFAIPPWITGMLKQSDLKDASMTGQVSALMSGRLGMFDNWELFDTNLYTPVTDGADQCWPILFGHKTAVCFASDIIETAYFDKFEKTVGKGMRGVQLFDWKVVKEDCLGVFYVKRG